jgi:hypothetical protein
MWHRGRSIETLKAGEIAIPPAFAGFSTNFRHDGHVEGRRDP